MGAGKPFFREIFEDFKETNRKYLAAEDAAYERGIRPGAVASVRYVVANYFAPIVIPARVGARRLGLGSH